MSTNREYKSSVFTALFNEPGKLLSLYNAVTGSRIPASTPVEIATLDDVLFTDRCNDIAFVVDDKLVVLAEHQSSINENMPLRMLLYIARVYEKIIDNVAIYSRKLLKIPRPVLLVLYNGTEPYPDEKTLKLSDAYKDLPDLDISLVGSLELEVKVLNINEGCNDEIIRQCEDLHGYSRFVGKVREKSKTFKELEDAIKEAIKECISEGILAEFLKLHASEVINMIMSEFVLEDALTARANEAREEGLEEGLDLSAEIIRALINNEQEQDIAQRYQVSVQKVKQLQSVLAPL